MTPTDGHYWDTKHGTFAAGVKMLIGAAAGKTLDDGLQGRLSVGSGVDRKICRQNWVRVPRMPTFVGSPLGTLDNRSNVQIYNRFSL